MKRVSEDVGEVLVKRQRQTDSPSHWIEYPNALRVAAWDSVKKSGAAQKEDMEVFYSALLCILKNTLSARDAAAKYRIPVTMTQKLFAKAHTKMAELLSFLQEKDMNDVELNGDEPSDECTVNLSLVEDKPIKDEPIEEYAPVLSPPRVMKPLKKGLDTIVGRLAAQQKAGEVKKEEPDDETNSSNSNDTPSGSNKRKPKLVSKYVWNEDEDDEDGYVIQEFDLFQELMNAEISERKKEGAPLTMFDKAIDIAVDHTNQTDKEKSGLGLAVRDVITDSMSIREAAKIYGISVQMITTYVTRTKKMYRHLMMNEGKVNEKDPVSYSDKKEYPTGPPLDPADKERLKEIEQAVEKVVKSSLYPNSSKERLRQAILMVVKGEYTINAAANIMQLPSSTVHPYVHKARVALGLRLPPQAFGPTLWNGKTKVSIKPSTVVIRKPGDKSQIDLDELDKIVTDLVRASHYDDLGKQKIFEATLAVLTEQISTMEAAKQHGLPSSTVQPYVQKTRQALGLPLNTTIHNLSFKPRSGTTPQIFCMKKKNEASYAEICDIVAKVLGSTTAAADRREKLFNAVVEAVSGKMTIKDACVVEDLPASTVHPYVSKARHLLGDRCPAPKTLASANSIGTTNGMRLSIRPREERSFSMTQEETIVIDGIEIPSSVRAITRLITEGKITSDDAKPFHGTKAQLKDKFADLVSKFKYKGDMDIMTEAMFLVIVNNRTLTDACNLHDLAQTTLSTYVRVAKIFIDSDNITLTDFKKPKVRQAGKKNKPTKEIPIMKSTKAANEAKKLVDKLVEDSWMVEPKPEELSDHEPEDPAPPTLSAIEPILESTDNEEIDGKAIVDMIFTTDGPPLYRVLSQYIVERQFPTKEQRKSLRKILVCHLADRVPMEALMKTTPNAPPEQTVRAFILRVREAYKCIICEYDLFQEETIETIALCDLPLPSTYLSKKGGKKEDASPVRSSRRLKEKACEEETEDVVLIYMRALFSDSLLRPLMHFLKRLNDVSFPLDSKLIEAFGRWIYTHLPKEQKTQSIDDSHWSQWAEHMLKTHPEFNE